MRKFVWTLICVFVFMVLVSCGTPEGGSAETSADSLPETAVTTSAETVGTSAVITSVETTSTVITTPSAPITKRRPTTMDELQAYFGCYFTTECSNNLCFSYYNDRGWSHEVLMEKDRDKIKVEHEAYGSGVFHITTFADGAEYKTTITLSEGVRMSNVYSGFISDLSGYVFIFHLEDYSISPMDDIQLACVLKTSDGGKTWDKTEFHDFKVESGREYITGACFFTEDIGFFTARYTESDHFGRRTYWTLDGGKTWKNMSRLYVPNILEAFGIDDDISSEVTDVTFADGVYTVLLRICHGHSLELNGERLGEVYIQYTSTDLVNWTLAPCEKGRYDAPFNTDELGVALQLPDALFSVLKNETKLYSVLHNSHEYLGDYNVYGLTSPRVYAFDLDENGVKDVVVLEEGVSVITLREYDGTVYGWNFRHSAMYNFLADGTHYWHELAGEINGCDKLHFEGAKRTDIELYREEYGEKFYVKGVEVSEEEYRTFIENLTLAEKATQYFWVTGFEVPEY